MENTEAKGTVENTEAKGTVENTEAITDTGEPGAKKSRHSGKNGHKIVLQIGAIIIVLFTLVTIAVGNMVTMSSFSTALSSNMALFSIYMENLGDTVEAYKTMNWLIDYWRDNSKTLIKKGIGKESDDDIDDILKQLSRVYPKDVTEEDITKLSPEQQERFAIYCYYEIQDIYRLYQDDDDDIAILMAMTEKEGDDPFVLLSNTPEEDGVLFGERENIDEIQEVIENTTVASEAEVWKWAFSTPDNQMLFGKSMPVDGYTGTSKVEMLGVFSAEMIYEDMVYTDHIKKDVIVMMMFVLLLILLGLYFIVPRPLEMVKKCVSEYSNTKDTDELTRKLSTIHSKNEIGAFADEFTSLALEMDRYTREMERLAGEREKVATELNVATNIQMQMLPQVFPSGAGFVVSASTYPAKEVGGDFYDCYMIDDDHMALTIADVSGKGVPAALFMAVSKTMLKNRTIVGGTPAEILHDVNNWLCEGNDSCMFVTVWHGILTISTGELVSANAGHENPGVRSGGSAFSLVKTNHGAPLGLVKENEYNDEHNVLSRGDALFVYTDGVPEANTTDEKMFGEERLEEVLSAVSKDDAPDAIMQKVKEAVDEFAGDAPQYDDLTMLCIIMNP